MNKMCQLLTILLFCVFLSACKDSTKYISADTQSEDRSNETPTKVESNSTNPKMEITRTQVTKNNVSDLDLFLQTKVSPDLRFELKMEKNEYKKDENIAVKMTLINISGRDLLVNDRFAVINLYPEGPLDVYWRISCENVVYAHDFRQLKYEYPQKKYSTLEKNKSIMKDISFPLITYFEIPYAIEASGNCSLQGVYINIDTDFNDDAASAWQGVVNSNVVEFTVK
jgi:hypothetical protein